MAKQKYNKPALTIEQQIEFLSKQGLIINNHDSAKQVLSVISYYRLSGYLLAFKLPHNHNEPRLFQDGIHFEKIWQLYQFDRELRLLVSDAIEKIEVAFRTALVNVTSVKLNPFWYTERKYFHSEEHYTLIMKNIDSIVKSKQELFVQHYFNKYDSPPYPPLWMMIETLSFGVCSKLFKNIKSLSTRKEIANNLGQHATVIESWLRTLSYTRNLCAHHARLWNRWFVNPPIIPNNEPLKEYFFTTTNYKFHIVSYPIQKLLEKIAPKSHWKEKLFELFEKYEECRLFSGTLLQLWMSANRLWTGDEKTVREFVMGEKCGIVELNYLGEHVLPLSSFLGDNFCAIGRREGGAWMFSLDAVLVTLIETYLECRISKADRFYRCLTRQPEPKSKSSCSLM